jgi:chemotaxis protein CheD
LTGARVYLNPGQWCCCETPAVVETILGSCLGIVIRAEDGRTCVSHCILARCDGSATPEATGKFVDLFIEETVRRFDRWGVARERLEAKLFGGANVLPRDPSRIVLSVGRQNVDTAIEALKRERIRVAACHVGGVRGRRISVHTGSGEVRVRALGRADAHGGIE